MKDSNLRLTFAKKFVHNAYDIILSVNNNLKEIKAKIKEVDKLQDYNLLAPLLTDEVKKEMNLRLIEYIDSVHFEISALGKKLRGFYTIYFENEIRFNVSKILSESSKIDKDLVNLVKGYEAVDLTEITQFNANIRRQLLIYKDKVKNDDFVEIDEVKRDAEKEVKACLKFLETFEGQYNNKKCLDQYLTMLEENFKYYYDNARDKVRTVPSWAKALLFLSPWLIGFFAFTFYPLLQTFIFSFSTVRESADGLTTTWLGFANYKAITQDTDFILGIKNYFATMLVYVPLITVFSLILALLLNTQVKGVGIFRTIFFFPVIITSGPVIKILIEQGVTSVPSLKSIIDIDAISAQLPSFLGTMFNTLTSEFIMILWYSGIQILVFITGLQRIDKGVYEAANIDGANKWEQFWKVTLPAINPVIVINVVFTVVMQSIFALNPIIVKIQADMNDTSAGKGYQYSSAIAFAYFLVIIFTLAVFVLIFKSHGKKGKKAR